MLMMLLEKKGLDASCTTNGLEAVDLISNDMDAYRLVLMDNLMPVMVSVCFSHDLTGYIEYSLS